MYYPLNFRFKLMTFTPEIDVTDAYGGTICHVRQQFFRLKEKVEVFEMTRRGRCLRRLRRTALSTGQRVTLSELPMGESWAR